jgi:polysaccharide export outer membrane protein
LLDSKLKDTLLNNPYYSIRFLNYRFTMLGEVTRPGVFNIPGERISLLDALGLAGDLTFFGRRDNVLIVRENNGKREFARLDLTKPEILVSPYFYLQQSDVVIVEPTKKKIATNDQVTARNVSIAASIVSTIAVVYSILKK